MPPCAVGMRWMSVSLALSIMQVMYPQSQDNLRHNPSYMNSCKHLISYCQTFKLHSSLYQNRGRAFLTIVVSAVWLALVGWRNAWELAKLSPLQIHHLVGTRAKFDNGISNAFISPRYPASVRSRAQFLSRDYVSIRTCDSHAACHFVSAMNPSLPKVSPIGSRTLGLAALAALRTHFWR